MISSDLFPLIRPIFAPWICVQRALNPPGWMEVFPFFQRQMMQETNGNHQSLEYFLELLNCRRIMPSIHLVTQLTATSGPCFFSGHNKPADVSKAKVDMLATWSQSENMVGLLVTGCCMKGTKKWGKSCIFRMVKLPREPAFAGIFPGIDHAFFWRISGVNQNQSDTYHILCTSFSVCILQPAIETCSGEVENLQTESFTNITKPGKLQHCNPKESRPTDPFRVSQGTSWLKCARIMSRLKRWFEKSLQSSNPFLLKYLLVFCWWDFICFFLGWLFKLPPLFSHTWLVIGILRGFLCPDNSGGEGSGLGDESQNPPQSEARTLGDTWTQFQLRWGQFVWPVSRFVGWWYIYIC